MGNFFFLSFTPKKHTLKEVIIVRKEITMEPEVVVQEEVFTEAGYPEDLQYLTFTTRDVFLPKGDPSGTGIACFLYTHNTKESFQLMLHGDNFSPKSYYHNYYYCPRYQGTIGKKRYRINDTENRNAIYKDFASKGGIIKPYRKLAIEPTMNENLYFDMSKYLEIFYDITKKAQPARFIPMYWNYMKYVFGLVNAEKYKKKLVLVNVQDYPISKVLFDNLRNPLFAIYYTAWKSLPLLKNVNVDFLFFYKNRIVKINPALLQKGDHAKIKVLLTRLYSYVPVVKDTEVKDAVDEPKIVKNETVENVVGHIKDRVENTASIQTYQKSDSPSAESEDQVRQEAKIETRLREKVEQASKELVRRESEPTMKEIEDRAEELINEDNELLESIYLQNVKPLAPKSAASTARDKKLLEEQEKIKVGNLTIKELEKIKVDKIEIPEEDYSSSLTTTNTHMYQNRFVNFEKVYNEKVMAKDLTNAILALNDKSIPLYIRDIKVEDTSDELNYKETYTIYLEDGNRKRHTLKVDIPKFLEDKFIYIGGNRKVIKKQDFFYPVVKTGPDEVQIVTNYNKMYIYRTSNKSLGSIERFKKLLMKDDSLKKFFKFGNSLLLNKEFITSLEYDELSKTLLTFTNGKAKLFFNCEDAKKYAHMHNIKEESNKLFIGVDRNGEPIRIDNDTQKTKDQKTIIEVILSLLPEKYTEAYRAVAAPKSLMYVKAKVMSKYLPLGVLIGFWEGLTKILKKMRVPYRLEEKAPKNLPSTESFIKFKDTYLVYTTEPRYDLLLNGFKQLETTEYEITEFDTMAPYIPYLTKVYGKLSIGNALLNTYEFIIDPITLEIIRDLSLPEDIVSLIIYATSLLTDSQYTHEIDQHISRVRSNEIVPAILYERLAKNYILYRNSNGRKKFSVPQDCVIKELLALKTVEDYSTLNPILEVESTHGISTKGFRGVNLEDSYTPAKRTYDKSMIGTIAASSPPDAQVGVNKILTMEPAIKSLRGYVDIKDDDKELQKLSDVNVFSPSELAIPLGATNDDPNRLGHSIDLIMFSGSKTSLIAGNSSTL